MTTHERSPGGLTLAVVLCTTGWCVGCSSPRARPQLSADLKPFLESYFAAWSKGDMAAYRAHFHERAHIAFLKDGKVAWASARDAFVEELTRIVARDKGPGVERMTSFSADEDRAAACVTAHWELKKGGKSTTGVDRFTLMRDAQGNWKILALVYYTNGAGE